ncbi:hypothetical protein A0O34_03895 [Chryseobacterium glaciei]|uniref:Uncharacterized protein n=2 Tax=Chryseobacterium glaciei TaxID=1685010 RepID=A0A172XS16_9FLAO|nr:hypothetical protein A0O34_03895 [Chryseobacterium glaciei]
MGDGNNGGGGGDGSGGGSGGGGYGDNDNPIIGGNDGPCTPNGVLTGPQIPNDDIGMNPCGGGIPTIPNVENPPTPCEKLKDLLTPSKANLKPLITNGMFSYINSGNKGEAGLYLRKDSAGNITTEIAPPSDTLSLPPKWGTSYYSMAHTHPKIAYPMFSYSDMMVLYNLEMKAYQYNNGHTSFLLVCEDENGVKQTYAIVFENIGQQVEDVWANPENIGLEPKQIVEKMDKAFKDKYDTESEKSNPNYERVFLQLNFGTNIGLYKASSDLTNWSKLTISENSDTAVVTPVNCN